MHVRTEDYVALLMDRHVQLTRFFSVVAELLVSNLKT